MKPCVFALLVVVGSVLVAAAGEPDGMIASPEPDWPQFRGPRRDGIAAERGLLQTWPGVGPKLAWKIDGLGQGWSSPIVVGQRLYITGDVGDDLVIYAFDRQGRLQWKATNGRSWTGSYPGARSSCTYAGGRLYHANAHGRLACLDAATGKELWNVNFLDRFAGRNITWALSESPVVDGRHAIVTPGGKKALMAALDIDTGQTLWTTEPLEDKATHASPILFQFQGRRLLASCSSEHGFGVDAQTGKRLWVVPLKNPHGVNASSPVYGDGRIFYFTAYIPGVQYRLVADGSDLRAERAWSCPLDTVTGGAILHGDTLYAAGYRNPKWWFGFDWQTGEVRGELKDVTTSSACYADGRLYCLAEDGSAVLLKPERGKLEIAGRFRISPKRLGDAWAHPVVFDGRLYLRYHDALWCYEVR